MQNYKEELEKQIQEIDALIAQIDNNTLRMTLKMIPGDMSLSEPYLFPELGDFRNAPPSYLFYGDEMIAGNSPLYERAFIKCDEAL